MGEQNNFYFLNKSKQLRCHIIPYTSTLCINNAINVCMVFEKFQDKFVNNMQHMTLNLKLQNTTLHFINKMYIIYMH